MYKDRIKKWGLDKKNKERDMVAILRKKTERKAVGKQTSFRVRGQVVAMEDVLLYFKRKGTRETAISAAPTPSDISCWTPSPVHTPQPVDNVTQMISTDCSPSEAHLDTFLPLAPVKNDREAGVVGRGWTRAPPFIHDEHVRQSARNDTYNFLSDRLRISYSPSSPQTLFITEHLLFSIKAYFDGSFDSKTWITDENGYCKTITPAATIVPDYRHDFSKYCGIAGELVEKGSYVEFRRVLSKAFNLVQDLLRAEHQRTLGCFFEVFLYLMRKGLTDIVSLLCNYISKMATNVIAKEHPWSHICRLIGMLNMESFEHSIIQSWKCTIDAFEKGLGQFNPSTLGFYLQFIHLVYGSKDRLEEERLLRGLLAQFKQMLNMSTSQATRVMLNLGYNMIAQGRYTEAEELGLDVLSQVQGDELYVNTIEALEIIAWGQYCRHETNSAEKNLRDAIEMVIYGWGMSDPWAIKNMIFLEGWLREWGRKEEADQLKTERDELIGKDEIDEQSVGE
jgi:hypothetical protein